MTVDRGQWSPDVPKKEGFYWGWGDFFDDGNEMNLVEVRAISNGFMYATRGSFLFENQMAGKVVFTKCFIPKPPKPAD